MKEHKTHQLGILVAQLENIHLISEGSIPHLIIPLSFLLAPTPNIFEKKRTHQYVFMLFHLNGDQNINDSMAYIVSSMEL